MKKSLVLLSALVGTVAIACGSEDAPNDPFGQDVTGTSSGSSGQGSSGFGSSGGGSSGAMSSGGNCGATVAEPSKPKVDIIFVIDDSGSMTEEMNQIKANVNTFASKIGASGLDYTVMFIVRRASSPTQTGNVICVPAPLAGANCSDNAPLFHHLNKDVQSRDSLDILKKEYTAGINWSQHLRADATKVFVEVTDDEASGTTDAAFDTFLLAQGTMFGTVAKRNYIFHSIVGWVDGSAVTANTTCAGAVAPGMAYRRLSTLTGGIVDSVCKTDYSGVLGNLAKGIADRLACELGVPSSAAADPTSMVVRVGTNNLTQVTDVSKCATIPNAWYYDDNAKPTKIILCKNTCDAATGKKVEALVGCKAPIPQ
jgi:hypothetical protein